ncbi:hypothetical protein [Neorhizobium sp. T6_25]|uniref:DUF6950 family protein n=1 Tax=Neorhizobium sp. T6_25 TaxID=2093833 RepID=UPI000CF91A37|nr:hypothetical protein [Neorhizobium sp. T6_25]
MRHDDWEKRLNAVVAKHLALPGQWGVSDCWMMTMDAIEAVTGSRILPHLQNYRSEADGYKVFRKAGFKETVEEALAAELGDPIPAMMAQRGDVGVIERDGAISCGVFVSTGFAVKTIYGHVERVGGKRIEITTGSELEITSVLFVKRAYKVR